MIQTVRRRQFDTRAVRWDGTPAAEAEIRALGADFTAIPEEDRGDDPDATGELREPPHGRRVLLREGDHVVAVAGGGVRYSDEEYRGEFEPVTA